MELIAGFSSLPSWYPLSGWCVIVEPEPGHSIWTARWYSYQAVPKFTIEVISKPTDRASWRHKKRVAVHFLTGSKVQRGTILYLSRALAAALGASERIVLDHPPQSVIDLLSLTRPYCWRYMRGLMSGRVRDIFWIRQFLLLALYFFLMNENSKTDALLLTPNL